MLTRFTLSGHARPLLALTINLLNAFDSLHITFLTTVPFFGNIQAEVTSHTPSTSILARLRIVAVKTPPSVNKAAAATDADQMQRKDLSLIGEDMGTQLAAFAEGLPAVIRAIWDGKPVYEASAAKELPGLMLTPALAIVDVGTHASAAATCQHVTVTGLFAILATDRQGRSS